MTTTPNMNLILPVPTVTTGPEYAQQNNTAFETVDTHDHTAGKGVQVPSEGININTDLTFNNQNAIDVNSVRFKNNPSALGGASDVNCAFVSGGELYYNNASGAPVQITAGGALNAASIGAIGGDYATSTASEYYVSPQDTFYFTSNTNIPANIDTGSVTVREVTTSPQGVTIQSPLALGASYNFILPTALPAIAKTLSLNASGQLATGVANTVDSTDLATDAVSTIKIQDGAVTGAKIADGTIPSSKFAVLPYLNVKAFANGEGWTCPAGVTWIAAYGIGGGGGGGASTSSGGSGGGGGSGLHKTVFLQVVPGTTYFATIGSGGPSNLPGSDTYLAEKNMPPIEIWAGGFPGASGAGEGRGGQGGSNGMERPPNSQAGGNGAYGRYPGGAGGLSGSPGTPAIPGSGGGGGGGGMTNLPGGTGGSGYLAIAWIQN